MPNYTIDGNEIEAPEGMSEEEATRIFRASQEPAEEKIAHQQSFIGAMQTPQNTPREAMSGGEMGVHALRTGLPVMAAFATKSPGALAMITGLSELGAQEMEDRLNDPTYQNEMGRMGKHIENAKEAAVSGGLSYFGDKTFLPWIGKAVNKLKNLTTRPFTKQTAGRMAMPGAGMAQEVETAQRFLGRMPMRDGKVFSLTLDQVHQGQKTLTESAGGFVRSAAVGGRPMKKSDIRNIDITNEWIEALMNSGQGKTPAEFGNAISTLFNADARYVALKTNAFYDAFRNKTDNQGINVNLTKAFDLLTASKDSRFSRQVLSRTIQANPAVIRMIDNGQELMQLTEQQLERTLAIMPDEMITEIIDGISTQAHTMPLENVVDMFHGLNRAFGGSKEAGIRRATGKFKDEVSTAMKEAVGTENFSMFTRANQFTGAQAERRKKKAIDRIFKSIGDEKPGAILHMFKGQNGLDSLRAVKKFFNDSEVLNTLDFEKQVRGPLRHSFLSRVLDDETGEFSGQKLKTAIKNTQENMGPEFIDELFGANGTKRLSEAATTLNVLNATSESSMVVKVIQAGFLAGGVGAITGGKLFESGTIQNLGMGAVAIGLLPLAAAKIMANPSLIRTFTDGMLAGPGTGKFARATMIAVNQNRDALARMKELSPEAQKFYDTPYEEEEAQPSMGFETLGDIGGTAGMMMPELPLR